MISVDAALWVAQAAQRLLAGDLRAVDDGLSACHDDPWMLIRKVCR
jgi:hypothetical protein